MIRHHGLDSTLRQLAVADLSALRRTDKTRLSDAERREIVVQHERLFALALDRIDDLRIAPRPQRRGDDCLGLTTRKRGRTVCAR